MFSRILSRRIVSHQKAFFTTNAAHTRTYGQYKKLGLVTAGLTAISSAAYYLSTDRDRFIEVFQEHQHPPYLALHPQRGGNKQLPVSNYYIDDTQEENEKPRLVIIGSGWGAVSVVKNLDKEKYNVTIISDNNYFLFTPLLPSATVGTLELRSLLEPVRKIASRIHAHFLEGRAVDIDLDHKYVEVHGCNENENFYVPYDKLIVAVGATSMTHGVDGIEHTVRLKTIRDAIDIRRKIIENVEKACLPTTTPEERRRLLSFVVCGGGPTGVEFAAEVSDWINEDLVEWFPKLIRKEISIHIIQSRDHILNTFDSKISDYAEKRFDRDRIDVITNARVVRIEEEQVVYKTKPTEANSEPTVKTLPYGLCLWSTGIAMTSFAKNLTEKLPVQAHKRVLTTDGFLNLQGLQDVYALGDCATIENPNLLQHIMEFIQEADSDKDGSIQFNEFLAICDTMRSRFPLTEQHLTHLEKMFVKYDTDKNGVLDIEELKIMLKDIDSKMTNLPATAQVASQQGQYLAKYLNSLASSKDELSTRTQVGPFRYSHLGTLAYLGNTAVGDFKWGYQMIGGLWALYLWRSIYWSEQVSMRTRLNLSLDWSKCAIWGRDISTV
ncbi:hypothetical protein MFLAVUS_004094 [Mucor flavus]|uniref:EF-hand domain-containing protein n=1 Tax=Mucor flavus TaxID=439312 RepID=A0ABP9YUW6_9FUNG